MKQDIRQLLLKYDKPGPRYTSYPPATHFTTELGNDEYLTAVQESNSLDPQGISLYLHIPFCNERCFFCGCNAQLRKKDDFTERYVNALIKEIQTTAALIDQSREVIQIHWGGGTPNTLSNERISLIMDELRKHFNLAADCEVAMECNPADMSKEDCHSLAEAGINRISLGIQDTKLDVLELVNRRPSAVPVKELVAELKAAGISSVNLDLIYGLPAQTVESFAKTVDEISDISPDRLATFSYAHVPWVMKAQERLEKAGLPTPTDKITMLIGTYEQLLASGYVAIGMDHYAKPNDKLAQALTDKQLHRNFQGYCTRQTTGQVYALGCSGISQLHHTYAQNEKDSNKYIEMIEEHGHAVVRGYSLSTDEQICRDVINEIMCNLYLDFDAIAEKHNTSADEVKKIVQYDESKLMQFREDGLLTIDNNVITIAHEGSFIIRTIAMEFDPQLGPEVANRYSRTV